ncbi:MAG: hypothetical protein M1834_007032 [Cirrosporium novae-zelandiae]|nr:MAG: hypothetical protein M1834_007032 [Cirrosporium novae-zelandiae]
MANRGKMMGMTFEDAKQKEMKQANERTKILLPWSLIDPLFQDLNQDSRYYLSYFASQVCKDLVIYDIPNHNPLRDLIPLTKQHAVLLHIIIANSALRLSNIFQRSMLTGVIPSFSPHSHPSTPTHYAPLNLSIRQSSNPYKDALIAKQHALRLLNFALHDMHSVDIDVALASVLLIEFELIDSGKDDWRFHINGARRLIDYLGESYRVEGSTMNPLRSCLVSNCVVYDILGSALTCSKASETPCSSLDVDSILQYGEANNYLSCPAILLQIILATAQLSQTTRASRQWIQ